MTTLSTSDSIRLISLDQYRGYTVLGMFFVNFVGGYAAVHALFKHHHTYCSYADTIMPQFLLAAGCAARLQWMKKPSTKRILVRTVGLLIVGLLLYRLDGKVDSWNQLQTLGLDGFFGQAFQRNFFQTLVHIALTGLWVWPVLGASVQVRWIYLLFSAFLFHGLSETWYYDWVMKRPGIDGGPFGFLSWSIAYIMGTIACDWLIPNPYAAKQPIQRLIWVGCSLMLVAYALSCLNRITAPNSLTAWTDLFNDPPFVPPSKPVNIWTMSQRAGSVSYVLFGAGFGLVILALFVRLCDRKGYRWGYLDLLGQNALAGYIIHDLADGPIKPYLPKDAPLWYVLAMFGLFLAIITICLRYMQKQKLYLRL